MVEAVRVDETPKNEITSKDLKSAEQYFIREITVVTPKGDFNIQHMMLEMSYYEDLFRGITTGYVMIQDAISFIENRNLTGNEYIIIRLSKTQNDDSQGTKIEKIFRVYRIENRSYDTDYSESYAIHFCSEALLLSEQTRISKAYSGKISDIVKDILQNFMNIPEQLINIHPTQGVFNLIVPNLRPIEAINWLAEYAIHSDNSSWTDFVFYQTRESYNFHSLSKLYELGKEDKLKYYYVPKNNLPPQDIPLASMLIIDSIKILDSFDTLYGINQGAFANKVATIDPVLRKIGSKTFNYQKYFDKSSNPKLNKYAIYNPIKNANDKYAYEEENSCFRSVVVNAGHEEAPYLKDRQGAYPNSFRKEMILPDRLARLALSHYHRIQITIPGHPILAVGDTLEMEIPSNELKEIGKYGSNIFYSGKYLISAVRHVVTKTNPYNCVVELIKDSTKSKYLGFSGDSATMITKINKNQTDIDAAKEMNKSRFITGPLGRYL